MLKKSDNYTMYSWMWTKTLMLALNKNQLDSLG